MSLFHVPMVYRYMKKLISPCDKLIEKVEVPGENTDLPQINTDFTIKGYSQYKQLLYLCLFFPLNSIFIALKKDMHGFMHGCANSGIQSFKRFIVKFESQISNKIKV